jgi:formylglycine-generating enzyme
MLFLLVNLSCTEIRRVHPEPIPINIQGFFNVVEVPPGSFQMGSLQHSIDEQPPHLVVLEHSFVIMKTEITQQFYKAVINDNPSFFSSCGIQCPVEKVRWIEAAQFANKLSEIEGFEGCYTFLGRSNVQWDKGTDCLGWRLPTEAEWVWAARGAKENNSYRYSGANNINSVAWYLDNSDHSTHEVCQKQENELGLCDMSGNVQEWVWDRAVGYSKNTVYNPKGGVHGSHRMARGGAWNRFAKNIHIAVRKEYSYAYQSNDIGFRLVRNLKKNE